MNSTGKTVTVCWYSNGGTVIVEQGWWDGIGRTVKVKQ